MSENVSCWQMFRNLIDYGLAAGLSLRSIAWRGTGVQIKWFQIYDLRHIKSPLYADIEAAVIGETKRLQQWK